MDFKLFEHTYALLQEGKLEEAVANGESKLKGMPQTDFHLILTTDLLSQSEAVIDWITKFYQRVSQQIQVRALYVELNAFDVNTDEWYLDGFAYEELGTIEDVDWLANWRTETATQEPLLLTGLEPLQEAFEAYSQEDNAPEVIVQAHDVAEVLVILRVQTLVEYVHQAAKGRGLAWGAIPLLVTAHEYEIIYQSS